MGEHLLRLKKIIQDFVAGFTSFEIEQTARMEKVSRQDLFIFLTLGNILGVPLLASYYAFRLLPYIYPALASWKKRMLREIDFTEIKTL